MAVTLRVLLLGSWLALSFTVAPLGAQRWGTLEESAQQGEDHHWTAPGGPLSVPRVTGAAFSADATTTLHKITLVGRKSVDLTATARYYRDGAGRVRVEQPFSKTAADGELVWVVIDNPDLAPQMVVIDPKRKVIGVLGRGIVAECIGGGHTFAVPLGYNARDPEHENYPRFLVIARPLDYFDVRTVSAVEPKEEDLGGRTIEGLATIGHRTTFVVPAGYGSEFPIELIDERWESPELKLLVYSKVSDSLTGTIEYRLANIQRREPAAELFVVDKAAIKTGPGGVGIGMEPFGNAPWK